jgi:hypothetical protein
LEFDKAVSPPPLTKRSASPSPGNSANSKVSPIVELSQRNFHFPNHPASHSTPISLDKQRPGR